MIFRLERKDKFRTIAIEKRLEAHQKAYAQCSEFIRAFELRDAEEVRTILKNGQEFCNKYFLYLEKGSRKKFIEALGVLNAYLPIYNYIQLFEPQVRKNAFADIMKGIDIISDLARLIQKEVELEPIVDNSKTIDRISDIISQIIKAE